MSVFVVKALIELFADFAFSIIFIAVVIFLLFLWGLFSNYPELALFILSLLAFIFATIYFRGHRIQNQASTYKIFCDAFQKCPTSRETIAAFDKLNTEQIKSFFRISYGDVGDSILKFYIKDALNTPDQFDYRELLKSNIAALEFQYTKYQKAAILSDYKLSKKPENSVNLWYRAELLDHYAEVCNFLSRVPIPELEEDFQLFLQQQNDEEKLILRQKEAAKKEASELKARKLSFLRDRLSSVGSDKLSREEVTEILMKSFEKEFGQSPNAIYRIRGKWHVKLDSETYEL